MTRTIVAVAKGDNRDAFFAFNDGYWVTFPHRKSGITFSGLVADVHRIEIAPSRVFICGLFDYSEEGHRSTHTNGEMPANTAFIQQRIR
jgi:hypothetical protein